MFESVILFILAGSALLILGLWAYIWILGTYGIPGIAMLSLFVILLWVPVYFYGQRRAVILRHREGKSTTEIAQEMSMSWDRVVDIVWTERERLERRGKPVNERLHWPPRN